MGALTKLVAHFQKFGIADGLTGSSGALRKTQVDTAQSERSVLEIGPLNSPAILGPNVKYMDVYDDEGLSKYAAGFGLDPSTVPSIDYVSPTGSFDMVDRKFTAVFSSHSIEHVPDLVRHLNNISTALEDGGRYYLIYPDTSQRDHLKIELEAALTNGFVAEQQLTKIKKTFSWRATKPLRSLARRISTR